MRTVVALALSTALWGCSNTGTVSDQTAATDTSSGTTVGLSNSQSSGTGSGKTTASTTSATNSTGTTNSTTAGSSSGGVVATGSTTGGPPLVPDPTKNGRYSVVQESAEITNSTTNDTFPIIYDYPTASPDAGTPAAGSCPLVLFAHGFSIDASKYETYASRLSSFGYVVVLPDYPADNEILTTANDDAFVTDILSGLDFALGNLPESDPKVTPLVDRTAIGISGHSLGGKLAILAAEQNSTFKASIDFDPVDDQSCGANCPSAIAGLGSLNIPTAFLGETTDQVPSSGFGPACAPATDNFQLFYAAAQSPSLEGAIPGAGATSFLDNQANCAAGCFNCTGANQGTTLDISHAMLVAFYERYLRNKTGYDAWLNGSLSTSTWVTPGELTLSNK